MKRVGQRKVYSLSELSQAVWRRFQDVPSVWVEAEVQDLRERRGQMRFRLVGDHSINASMSAIVFERLPNRPSDGSQVHAYGRVEFYRPAHAVAMRVERVELTGEGLLRAQIEALRAGLGAEGLLAAERKRALPLLPGRIGLVTSAAGAARDDFLRNLWQRHPTADVVLVDVPVQGEQAPAGIVRALRHLDRRADVDVIVVARGGGSLEDLMAFNSEPVCRAVAACTTAVVAAIGHETDVTVCDLVADRRVSTPTAAAEAVVPDMADLERRLAAGQAAIRRALEAARRDGEQRLQRRSAGLVAGLRVLGDRAGVRLEGLGSRLAAGATRAALRAPVAVEAREGALTRAVRARLAEDTSRAGRSEALLGALSPRRTVQRGYAIVRDPAAGAVVSSVGAVRAGQELVLELADGELAATAGERR